jgi:5-amino-6-(5-phospho-D-ribitylamino)uracil phosphatase
MPDLVDTQLRRTLYVSDLDGTLLATGGAVSPRSAELLNGVIGGGGLVTFATARSFTSARRATEAVRFALPLITYGGTMVADPDTGATRDERLLAAPAIEQAMAVSEQHEDVQLILHTLEGGLDWLRWDPTRLTPGTDRFVRYRAGDRRLRPITPDDPYDPATVFYVASLAPRPSLVAYRAQLAPVLAGVAHFLSEDVHTPGLDWLEFHHAQGTKAAAVTRLAAELGADRIVVFGDNHNDVPMFEVADEGYAMANAVTELKRIATGVLGDHDSDSVAEWIAADHGPASVEP